MSTIDIITKKINSSISVTSLDIEDDSARHAGHAGWKQGGETHFNIRITSPDFKGLSKVQIHRLIYDILKEEMDGKIHALSIRAEEI